MKLFYCVFPNFNCIFLNFNCIFPNFNLIVYFLILIKSPFMNILILYFSLLISTSNTIESSEKFFIVRVTVKIFTP
jgi:hypothetical protein